MYMKSNVSADKALQMLRDGNRRYIGSDSGSGDISLQKRQDTLKNGQQPYAVIVTCSDSRVIPEYVFSAGLGELFVIRSPEM